MSNLEHLTPEEKSEVVKIASRLRDEETARAAEAQEHRAFVEAAAEVDLPQDYLERAAAELEQTRTLKAQKRTRTRRTLLAAGTVVLASAALWQMTYRPAPQANVYTFSAQEWKLNTNPETKADVSFQDMDGRKSVAIIHVDQFVGRTTDGQYFANLDAAPTVNSFSRYKTTSFFVKSSGVPNIRLYLEANSTERWRSPNISMGADWQKQTIDLNQYEHQIRESPTSAWHKASSSEQPDHLEALSFKVGTYMNDINTRGDVAIDDLEIR